MAFRKPGIIFPEKRPQRVVLPIFVVNNGDYYKRMDIFTISDLEHLTGIKAHTLRTWEQRYGILHPGRKKSQHRIYSDEDLKYILRIVFLYNKGLKISKIARLSEAEIKEIALGKNLLLHESAVYLNRLTEASIDFNEEQFEEDLVQAINHIGMERAMEEILFPFLKRMGIFWLTGHVLPAQEHFASNIIIRKIIAAIESAPAPDPAAKRKVLLFTPPGEFHEIPLLFVYYLLKKNGVRCIYLGTDKTLSLVKEVADAQRVTELFLLVITNLTKQNIQGYLEDLSRTFPQQQIYYSGSAINQLGEIRSNVHCLSGTNDFHRFISSAEHNSAHPQ